MHLLYCHLFGERFENNRLCCRQFHDTFSTQLEIENVVSCLHALEPGSQVVVYTDCQALCHTILHRRTRLEEREGLINAAVFVGSMPEQDAIDADPSLIDGTILDNYAGPARFLQMLAPVIEARGGGVKEA